MFIQKRLALQPLIESRDGNHVTIYLANSGNGESLRTQLNDAIDYCQDHLEPVLGAAKFAQFMMPIETLLHDAAFLDKVKTNVGIFRTTGSFRFIKIPLQLEYLCGVATSYHIKPLLRWLQLDREFILFTIEANALNVYHGSQYSLKLLESSPALPKRSNFQDEVQDTVAWIANRILSLAEGHKVQVFAAGRKPLMQSVLKALQQHHTQLGKIRTFEHNRLSEIYSDIRFMLRKDAMRELEQAFIEYHCADEIDMTNSTIQEIAQAAIQGRVRKLIIAIGVQIFGKLDHETGKLSLHPEDLDHEDDDILDDLAQIVLNHGGEIVVANKLEMPKGKPALAILQHDREAELVALEPWVPQSLKPVASIS